jgi:hypothetical protein
MTSAPVFRSEFPAVTGDAAVRGLWEEHGSVLRRFTLRLAARGRDRLRNAAARLAAHGGCRPADGDQVATVHRCPPVGTVKSRGYYALRALRESALGARALAAAP